MRFVHFLFYPFTPHLETDLELIQREIDAGHEVEIFKCRGQLDYCLFNPFHGRSGCAECVLKTETGLKQVNGRFKTRVLRRRRLTRSPVIGDQSQFRNLSHDGVNIGIGALSDLIGRFGYQFSTQGIESLIARILKSEMLLVANLADFDGYRDVRFVVFNGRFSTFRTIVEYCKARGIEYVSHERAGSVERFTYREGAIPHEIAPAHHEMVRLWDQTVNAEVLASAWYEGRRNRVVQNWVVFTQDQQDGMLPDGFDYGKRNVAIFNSTIEEYETIDCWKNDLFSDEVIALRQLMDLFQSWTDFHFYIRLHPNLKNFLTGPQMKKIMSFACPSNFTIIAPEASVHSYALIDACEKVLTFGSTIGIEAVFWGKPSILLGKAYYQDLNATYNPLTRGAVVELVAGRLEAKDRLGALIYGNWEVARGSEFVHFQPMGLFGGTFKGMDLTRLDSRSFLSRLFEQILVRIPPFRRISEQLRRIRKLRRGVVDG